jgi:putative transposase
MTGRPAVHRRRSIRLPGYDYTRAGAYFITMCAHRRAFLFGEIVAGEMRLNEYGEIVRAVWLEIPAHFPHVELGEFVVMPDHVHAIIIVRAREDGEEIVGEEKVGEEKVGARIVGARIVGARHAVPQLLETLEPAPRPENLERFGKPVAGSIPTIVRSFKSAVAKRINERRRTPGAPVWQRNYYERVIRDERAYNHIAAYIQANPTQWGNDQSYSGE